MIRFGEGFGRVKAKIDDLELEVVLTNGLFNGQKSQYKKFLVNGVARRRIDFAGNFPVVLFSPQDLEIIVDSPSLRRSFLDEVLEQVDKSYRLDLISFTKALRQRNALLEVVQTTGVRSEKQFEYWENLIIEHGQNITKKRQEFIDFVNANEKNIFDFYINYDKSIISKDRLLQYKQEEIAAGVTLVGPHRDDFSVAMFSESDDSTHDIKFFGSRGQQRLAILQLKQLELAFIEKTLGEKPIFLLDDIFSELDEEHIEHVFEMIGLQQTILTTTHQEFIPKSVLKKTQVIKFAKAV
jgi:DNA replication and repair protein RecF